MTRLATTFDALRARQRKALVVYLTAGDPDLETSLEAAREALAAGADVLEIGVPFSDPVADGPVIQRAMGRAIQGGGGLSQALELVRRIRAESDAPLVLFGYLNPWLWEGLEATCQRVKQAGADGALVVDLPHEESAEAHGLATASGLDWVRLVAPTSGTDRARRIAERASGFLYAVSMTGVTGGQLTGVDGIRPMVTSMGEVTDTPVCVGFGVHDGPTARAAAGIADGVVVGSAVVTALEAGAHDGSGPRRVGEKVAELRRGLDGEENTMGGLS